MKKVLLVVILLSLFTALSGCARQNTAAPSASALASTDIGQELLSGYPLNALPLYEAYTIETCSFSCRGSDEYSIGKDIYSVTFQSNAGQADLYLCYSGILTETDVTETQDEYEITDALSGKIGENGVEINILDNSNDTCTVYLTYGLTPDQYSKTNPFFADYPADYVDVYGQKTLTDQTYSVEYYTNKTTAYTTLYETALTQKEFAGYYSAKYGAEQSFTATEGDSRTSYTWQSGPYTVSAAYTEGSPCYISLQLSKTE